MAHIAERRVSGNPELIQEIVDEIRVAGAIPFARFMELALYHPTFGYYTSRPTTDAAPASGEERIGFSGDFYTSSDVHPLLGHALARQVRQIDDLLGRPDPFTLIEQGGGKGLLARDLLSALEKSTGRADSLLARLQYVFIERSPAMRAAQQRTLATWREPGRSPSLTWLDDTRDLADNSVCGVFFSNELVDAFPIHRLVMQDGRPKELFVTWRDGGFVEELRDLSSPALEAHLARLARHDARLADGAQGEVNLAALEWMRDVARSMARGVVITIDYGHTAQDIYGPQRRRGTLLCYSRHKASEAFYERVGEQDMTAHVDFTSLAAAGEEAGLRTTGFTNQMSFLIGLGAELMLAALPPDSDEFRKAVELLHPNGMGKTFKVLVQHKGLDAPQIDGLAYKAFFGAALTGARG